MTDYTRATGTSGTMMIRDTGSTIEFWLNSNNSTTWSDHIPWSGTVNNTNVSGSYYYHAGSGWQRLGVWTVSYGQNVTFKLGSTGTGGFGGPTTLGPIWISRATIPPQPNSPVISLVGATVFHASFTDNGDGGAAIDDRVIGYSTDINNPWQNSVHGNNTDITGLTPGTKYYVWSVVHNSLGWSAWSSRVEVTTLNVPEAPSAPVATDVDQVSVTLTFTPNGDGGAPISAYEIGYSLDSSGPTNLDGGNSPKTVSGLSPGITYYFWVRALNSVGWGPWSASTMVTLIAGAYINVGGVWKRAVPYVNVAGTWKVARAWGRVAGTWRETL